MKKYKKIANSNKIKLSYTTLPIQNIDLKFNKI